MAVRPHATHPCPQHTMRVVVQSAGKSKTRLWGDQPEARKIAWLEAPENLRGAMSVVPKELKDPGGCGELDPNPVQ